MSSPAQRCARLVSALEDLAAQEEASVRALDFAAVDAIQERASALIDALVAQSATLNPALRARLAAVRTRRAATSDGLEAEIGRTRESLRETGATQRRVAQIAPAYGRPVVNRPRLQAVS